MCIYIFNKATTTKFFFYFSFVYTTYQSTATTSSFVESSRKTDQGSGIMVFKMPQMGLLNFLIQTPPSIKNDDNRHAYICKFFFERTFHWQIQLGIYIYVTIFVFQNKNEPGESCVNIPKDRVPIPILF